MGLLMIHFMATENPSVFYIGNLLKAFLLKGWYNFVK